MMLSHETTSIPGSLLLAQARALLAVLDKNLITEFLQDWPAPSGPRRVPAQALPVLQHLSLACESAPDFSALFMNALVPAAGGLAWRRSYAREAVGDAFFDNYGWTELAGLTGPIASQRLACGILVLGPQITYPLHRHEAEEIYVPLSGIADWKKGKRPWASHPPGTMIHHARHEPHAMRTGTSPLVALYLWRSANLAQKSQLD